MCGINGFLSFNGLTGNAEQFIQQMNDRIAHRGPDDRGIWHDDSRALYFGHLRLSILDLSPCGHQPMISQSGNTIVFNGEIYNYKEIREQFFKDTNLKSTGDTEIILLLYEKFGADCLAHLEGMFAFAIWDAGKEELFIARDRAGKKPFYYSFQNQKFSFSSEIKSLLGLPWIKKELDENALYHFLTFNMLAPPQTMFRNIHKMDPGSFMIVRKNGEHTIRSFWEVQYSQEDSLLSEEDASEKILFSLKDAVKKRMVSDVPVGAFLSGGVDSSAIVAIMSAINNNPVKTFSVGFKDQPDYDELYYASEVAKLFRTDHEEILVTSEHIQEFLPHVVDIFDEPMADETCIPIYFLARAARKKNCIVVQTGDGSDELFAGYNSWMKYKDLHPRFEKLSSLPLPLRRMAAGGMNLISPASVAAEMLSRSAKDQEFFQGGARSFKENVKSGFLSSQYREEMHDNDSWKIIEKFRNNFDKLKDNSQRKFTYTDWMCYLGFKFIVPNHYLYRMDHLGMANSIEIRSPFLDYNFVNLALSVSSGLKTQNQIPKYILKKSLESILPDNILYRKKMGFCVPIREWGGEIMISYIEQNLKSFCNDHPQFNYDKLNALLQTLKNGNESSVNRLWTLYFLIAWFNKWMD